tara:strand:+ start:24925 stop:25542 length:618 start_codon:yes stop_codon:yes gene_type:complete
MVKDPICGMDVNISHAKKKGLVIKKNNQEVYFCSKSCKEKFDKQVPWYRSDKFSKIFPYSLAIVLILGTALSMIFDFMVLYMGIFFIIFSLFKMPDWKGFSAAFREYDLLAKVIKPYAPIYPLIELLLGVLFIVNYFVKDFFLAGTAWITLIIMSIGGIGVGIKLSKREKFQCACLGTWINVPLTKVTLLEDVLMVIMALILLFF